MPNLFGGMIIGQNVSKVVNTTNSTTIKKPTVNEHLMNNGTVRDYKINSH